MCSVSKLTADETHAVHSVEEVGQTGRSCSTGFGSVREVGGRVSQRNPDASLPKVSYDVLCSRQLRGDRNHTDIKVVEIPVRVDEIVDSCFGANVLLRVASLFLL